MAYIAFALTIVTILFETIGMGWAGSAFALLSIIAIIAAYVEKYREENNHEG